MKHLEQIVAESPVFAGLDDAYLRLIAGCGRNTGFEPGEYLFREGASADTFYLLRQGRVGLETNVPGWCPLTIGTVDAGDVVGWSWLVAPYRWHFDARAIEPVRAIVFDGACLRGKCEDDHTLGYELLGRFAPVMLERLQAARLQLMDVYGSAA
jgi:CRP-like cAMP-binding protein